MLSEVHTSVAVKMPGKLQLEFGTPIRNDVIQYDSSVEQSDGRSEVRLGSDRRVDKYRGCSYQVILNYFLT